MHLLMSTSKLDRSGVFHPLSIESSQLKLEIPAHSVRFRKNGLEFISERDLPLWTEMNVDVHSLHDGRRVTCNGVVVHCQGNRHTGFRVSMVCMNLTRQAQAHWTALAASHAV